MREIPALRERDSGFPTTNVTNEIVRAVQAMAPIIQTGQADPQTSPVRAAGAIVRVDSAATAGSAYNITVMLPKSAVATIDMSAAGAIDEADIFEAGEVGYLINGPELTHDVHGITETINGRYFPAVRLTVLAQDGRPIYFATGFGWVLCG
jgi:hypothetical protein